MAARGEPRPWTETALNTATESENRIHADDVARRHGFRGGLVPGVVVHAYLVHPGLVAWGRDWLERGHARIALRKPLYDSEKFQVTVRPDGAQAYHGEVLDAEGVLCAEGRVSLPEAPPDAPARRGDRPAPPKAERPEATREALETLRKEGMGAFHARWDGTGEMGRYVRDPRAMAPCVRPDGEGLANPAFVLGLANWALAANVRLGPWLHIESDVQHFAAIPRGAAIAVESSVADLFERAGHAFVDLDVSAYLDGDRPALTARHRAIYRLRGA
jgi:hypothetical protein